MAKKPPFHAELRKAVWSAPYLFEVLIWVYPADKSVHEWAMSDAWLEDQRGNRYHLDIAQVPDPLANEKNKISQVDASKGAFEIKIDFRGRVGDTGVGRQMTFKVAVQATDGQRELTLTQRYRWGSARTLWASEPIASFLVVPEWGEAGLGFSIRKPTVSCKKFNERFQGFDIQLQVDGEFAPKSLELVGNEGDLIAQSEISPRKSVVKMRLDQPSRRILRNGMARLYAADGDKRRLVHMNSSVPTGANRNVFGRRMRLSRGPAGVMRLEDASARTFKVIGFEIENDTSPLIRLTCSRNEAGQSAPVGADLVGNRSNVGGTVLDITDTSFTVEFRLLTRGEGQGSTLTPGGYRVRLRTADDRLQYLNASDLLQRRLYESHVGPLMNVRVESTPKSEFYLHVDAPKAADEVGIYNQTLLAEQSANSSIVVVKDFYLESWFGKSVSDNQLPLVREIQSLHPDANIWVGIIDYSVATPPGTKATIIGSRQWWQAIHGSKYIITNSWLPNGFKKQLGQIVVQTWHGTPLKFLGLDRPDAAGRPGRAKKLSTDANTWDLLVSQNGHSSEAFRSAYRYEGEIAEVGYPRNDALVSARVDERRRIRHALGLADEDTAILYAPTWRESDKSASDFLDVSSLSQKLGAGHKVLLRGHSVTLRRGSNVDALGVVDVTAYPNAAELMIAADALVTDYSSIMFDFTVTGKPIVFYTPDYEEYTSGGRGVYFDLRAHAPGPMSTTQDELVAHLHALDEVQATYASAYDSWRKRFNAWDDGESSRKLMRRVFKLDDDMR